MGMNFKAFPTLDSAIVYVRAVPVDDLPADVQAMMEGVATLYSVHRADGERVAVTANRDVAFSVARQHDMVPVSVH